MDADLILFLVAVSFAACFFGNVLPGERVADALSTSPVTLPEGSLRARVLRRPRFLTGRLLVGIWFVTFFLAIATQIAAPAVSAGIRGLLALAAVGLFIAASIIVLAWQRSLAQQPRARLDERERHLQGAVYLVAYRIVASVLAAAFAVGVGAVFAGWRVDALVIPEDESGLVNILAIGAFVLYCLPSLVHAWLEPRPEDAEDESSAPRAALR